MKLLAAADALLSLSGHRRQQVWDAAGLHSTPELLQEAPVNEEYLKLQAALEREEIVCIDLVSATSFIGQLYNQDNELLSR